MSLELASLHTTGLGSKAVDSLDRALQATEYSPHFRDYDSLIRGTSRSGVIQSFEVTYEQCWKMMKRWIEENVGAELVDGTTPPPDRQENAARLVLEQAELLSKEWATR